MTNSVQHAKPSNFVPNFDCFDPIFKINHKIKIYATR